MYILVLTENKMSSSFLAKGLKYENLVCDPKSIYDNWDDQIGMTKYHGIIIRMSDEDKINVVLDKIKSLKFKFPIFILSDFYILESIMQGDKLPVFLFPDSISIRVFAYKVKKEISKILLPNKDRSIKVADLKLDLHTREAIRFGNKFFLRNMEFHLLEYLMRNTDKILSRQKLLERVWDRNSNMFTNTIDVHVNCLRRKIDYMPESRLIETVYCTGYIMHSKTKNNN